MSRLIVRFHDASLDEFSWFVDKGEGNKLSVSWSLGSEQQLAELSKNQPAVLFVIPQQDVYLTSYEVPDKASRQVISSIEYQIEDQLAQDVELQHFSTGSQSSNPVEIAVVEKSIMQRCSDLIQKHGLPVTQIVPEIFLCPWSGKSGEVSLIESYEGVILRYGSNLGIKCRAELC